VYEAQDFEEAITLAASAALPLDKLITNVCSLDDLEWGLRQLEKGGEVMKVLIEC
jgi:threonine dehydrogenase-like Zn-dependent dehydrogenase